MGSGNPKRGVTRVALAIGFWAVAGAGFAACRADRLDVRTASAVAQFSVEVADDGAERAQGLMFREEMASMAGMLFVYESPRAVAFWMKNTLIPLDMIFADRSGTVLRVHENAVPGNLTPVDGGTDIQYVLEINGGMARKLGLAAGAVLRHPAIGQDNAAWRCD